MAYRVKTYTLREEAAENGTRYFISFKDGQGGYHELEVSEQFFTEFRQMNAETVICCNRMNATKNFSSFPMKPLTKGQGLRRKALTS